LPSSLQLCRSDIFTLSLHDALPIFRGGVQDDVVGPAFDAAFQNRLQRLVGGIIAVERQVIAEHDEMKIRGAQQRHQRRQALDILDRKSTRLNSSHGSISYAVFCLKK